MGVKTPTRILEKVLKLWLLGFTREEISQKVGTSVGNIVRIVKEAKENLPDIVLLRKAAVWIRKNGWKQDLVSTAIRHRNFLYGRGLTDEQIDDLIELLDEHCFKRGIKMDSFIEMLKNVSVISKRYGRSIEELDELISDKEGYLEDLKNKEASAVSQYHETLQMHSVTHAELLQYRQDLPLIDTIKNLKIELDFTRSTFRNITEDMSSRAAEIIEDLTAHTAPEGMEPKDVNRAVRKLIDSPEHFEKETRSILDKESSLPSE